MDPRFIGFFGIAVLILLAVAISSNRRSINLRIVLSALALQIAIAVFVLKTDIGAGAIGALSAGVSQIIAFSDVGIRMMFGSLADSNIHGVVFAIQVLPIIIFFSAFVAVLYYLRIMQLIVAGVGAVLRVLIGTRPIESLNAAANIFLGQTEAPLAVKPYLDRLTSPQLFAIMVSGLASVAGSVLAAYAKLGVSADFLLAASFMSAPGGLLMAKLIVPDDRNATQDTLSMSAIVREKSPNANLVMSAAVGAQDGLNLALNVGAMLIAFVALISLVNGVLGGIGDVTGLTLAGERLSLQAILGFVFAPLLYVVGAPWEEARQAGAIFGEKLVLNEFVAYIDLAKLIEGNELSEKTVAILTFALCGFANLSSIAILLGGLGSLMPGRMSEIARYGMRAVAAGSLSNLMSATIAGLLISF